jgi:hypothetical protein
MPQKLRQTILLVALLFLLAVPAMADDTVPPGRITVYSTPSGARTCIDNKYCDITPATFTVEGNAWHMAVVTEKGYRDWTETVYVTADQTSRLDAYLDLDPNATAIRVSVSPGGGTICLDNSQCRSNVGTISTTGSTLFTGVSPGYHTISVESPTDYLDTQKLVQVELGQVTEVSIVLEAFIVPATPVTKATGAVRVYVDRTGSTVCLDNADCAENLGGSPGPGTATTVFSEVTADEVHIVTVAADGFKPFSAKVLVEKDKIKTVDVSLQPLDRVTTVLTTAPATTVSPATTVPLATNTPPPTMPTARSGLSAVPALGALALCGLVIFFCKDRK